MRIGLILSNTPGYSETFFNSKIKGLEAHGHEVILYTQTKQNDYTNCKVKTAYPITKRNQLKQFCWFGVVFYKLIFYPRRVRNFIQSERLEGFSLIYILKRLYGSAHILTERIDWLHFGFATMALGKENVARSMKAKMAVSFRGFDMAIYPMKHPNCYDLLWKRVDKVHSISDDLYELALQNGLLKNTSYQKITPAIDINLFKIPKKAMDMESDVLKMLTVGRLHWKKGFTYTLMALKQLQEQGVKFHYTVVGEGDEFEKLMYIRHQLGLDDCVTFLGKVAHHEVKNLMSSHDLYIQYSISEGFCNAVLEAQAMGLLCVVSDAEGLSENVLHEQSGWVVPKRNPEKLAERIIEVSKLKLEVKRKIRNFAVNRVRNDFNLEKQQQEFLKFYWN
jgi:colanic acid/amylovoran biosynthesis glycosyltransferase